MYAKKFFNVPNISTSAKSLNHFPISSIPKNSNIDPIAFKMPSNIISGKPTIQSRRKLPKSFNAPIISPLNNFLKNPIKLPNKLSHQALNFSTSIIPKVKKSSIPPKNAPIPPRISPSANLLQEATRPSTIPRTMVTGKNSLPNTLPNLKNTFKNLPILEKNGFII